MKDFTAADIRVFLATNLPYYESEDKDDFIYLAKADDLERVSLALYRHLTHNAGDKADRDCCSDPTCSVMPNDDCFGCSSYKPCA